MTAYVPLQAYHAHDPWKVLVVCALLDLTSRDQVRPVVPRLFYIWPSANDLACSVRSGLVRVLHPLGLGLQRAERLRALSRDYTRLDHLDYATVVGIHGCGVYAADSFETFCRGNIWHEPTDRVLRQWVEVKREPQRAYH